MTRGFTDDDGWMNPPEQQSATVKAGDEMLEFNGVIVASSAKAWKFEADQWKEAAWIPKSQSELVDLDESNKQCVMRIKAWLCEKNGWREI